MQFKILFPTLYQVKDIHDDNLDLNIVLDNGEVYFGTLFTLKNIDKLMKNNEDVCFWSTDMLILKDLSYETINTAIETLLRDSIFNDVFSKIGTVNTVFLHLGWKDYSDVLV